MTQAAALLTSRSEFDDFLFASIGEETNGMVLSVISALVRLNVDPWQEAAKLARLPAEKAIQSLGALLAKLPDETFANFDPKTTAIGLVARLPRAKSAPVPLPALSRGMPAVANPWALTAGLIVAAAVLLGVVMFFLLHHQPTGMTNLPRPAGSASAEPVASPFQMTG